MDKDVVDDPLLDKVVESEGVVKEWLMDGFWVVTVPDGLSEVVSGDPDCRSCYFGSEWSRPEPMWPFGFCSIKW